MFIQSDLDIAAFLCVRRRKSFAKRNCAVHKNLTAFPENFHRFPGENIQNVRYAPRRRHRCVSAFYSSIGLLLLDTYYSYYLSKIQCQVPDKGQPQILSICVWGPWINGDFIRKFVTQASLQFSAAEPPKAFSVSHLSTFVTRKKNPKRNSLNLEQA